MDKAYVLFFTMGKIDDHNAASSGKITEVVSRKRHTDDMSTSSKKYRIELQQFQAEQLQMQRDMVNHVAKMGIAVEMFNTATQVNCKEELLEKKFQLEMKRIAFEPDHPAVTLIDNCISEIMKSIEQLDKMSSPTNVIPNIGGMVAVAQTSMMDSMFDDFTSTTSLSTNN